MASAPGAYGENTPGLSQPNYLSNLDHMTGFQTHDGTKQEAGEKDMSMYSYSKVSRDLKEESFLMRQLRDYQLASKT